MESYMKEALEIVKAQASVRNMTEEEITSMVSKLSNSIKAIDDGSVVSEEASAAGIYMDPKKAIKEKSIVCMECGGSLKLLSKRHLAAHGLTPQQYREKYGYKSNQPLTCKALSKARKAKMSEMRLWEKRTHKEDAAIQA